VFVGIRAVIQKGKNIMATSTPPPYFPQSSLSPPDEGRYRKFKIAVFGAGILLILLLGGIALGVWYLVKWIF
jgi:hypothetical protein